MQRLDLVKLEKNKRENSLVTYTEHINMEYMGRTEIEKEKEKRNKEREREKKEEREKRGRERERSKNKVLNIFTERFNLVIYLYYT